MQCSVAGCAREIRARALCDLHLNRLYKRGEIGGPSMERRKKGTAAQFIRDALSHPSDDCLIWPFPSRTPQGYGLARFEGKWGFAHRFVCELAHGVAPEGVYAAHSCGNGHKGCVNPRHLSWKTVRENFADRVGHGTNGQKLNNEDVQAIRGLRGLSSHRQIAMRFGISKAHVSHILSGRKWFNLPEQQPT